MRIRIQDLAGVALVGAAVKSEIASAQSGDDGAVLLALPAGKTTVVRVSHPAFSSRFRRIRIDTDMTLSDYLVQLRPRGATQQVTVEDGANLTSMDGGALKSFGVTEFEFSQNGEALSLVAGTRASIDIPMYASRDVSIGMSIPLWALDPNSGIWIQEGVGTVVAADTPTGFALRGEVGHFSWWNCNQLFESKPRKTKCCFENNLDMVCDSPGECFVRGLVDFECGTCNSRQAVAPAPVSPVTAQLSFDGLEISPASIAGGIEVYGSTVFVQVTNTATGATTTATPQAPWPPGLMVRATVAGT